MGWMLSWTKDLKGGGCEIDTDEIGVLFIRNVGNVLISGNCVV